MSSEINKIFGNGEGGYVFISHSHQDIEKVRKIRNAMEEQRFEPLCFYLRCLTDDDEVEGLIKREIDAREVFVYLDSENARNSKWVQKELEYIQTISGKTVRTIDLDKYSTDDISNRIMDSMRVFMSYSNYDKDIVSKFRDILIERNLKVFSNFDLSCGQNWSSSILNELEQAAKHGCVILFVSKHSIDSKYVEEELYTASELEAMIIPIFIDITFEEIPDSFKHYLTTLQCFFVKRNDLSKNICNIIERIEECLYYKFYE